MATAIRVRQCDDSIDASSCKALVAKRSGDALGRIGRTVARTHDGDEVASARAAIGARIPHECAVLRQRDVREVGPCRAEFVLALVDVELQVVGMHPGARMELLPGTTDLFTVLVHGLARRHFAQGDLVAGRDRLGSLDQPPLELQLGPRRDVDPRYGDIVARVQVNPRIGG